MASKHILKAPDNNIPLILQRAKRKNEQCEKYDRNWAFFKGIENFRKGVSQIEHEVNCYKTKAANLLPEDFQLISDDYQLKDAERAKIGKMMYVKIQKLRNDVIHLSHVLKEDSKNPTQAINKHAELVERVKVLISIIKLQEQLFVEEMNKEEQKLEKDIALLNKRFDKSSTTHHSSKYAKHPSLQIHSTLPQVQEFEEFVEKHGGHQEGWEDYEHQMFLRIRGKYKGKLSFLKEASEKIIVKSPQEIAAHELWYKEYLDKKVKNAAAIKTWREEKEKEKQNEKQQKHNPLKINKDEKERLEEKEKINQWKAIKYSQIEEKEQKDRLKKLYDQKKLQKDREHQEVIHEKVEEYKTMMKELTDKWKNEEVERKAKEKRRKAEEAKIGIIQFQSKDQSFLLQKEERERQKHLSKLLKEARLSKLKKNVSITSQRDPRRLLKLTKACEERRKPEEKIVKTGLEGPIRMPHKAIPTWIKPVYK